MPLMNQVVYMSTETSPFEPAQLTDLLIKARQKNSALGISGLLVYHEGVFLQVLEGEVNAVDNLYQRIKQDDRHTKCELLLRTYIDKRSFCDWSMGYTDTKLFGSKMLQGYNDLFGETFSRDRFLANKSLARQLILAFRDGQWRQNVESGEVETVNA